MVTSLPPSGLLAILSIIIPLALIQHSHVVALDMEEDEEYVVDDHFLANKIKKGARCDASANDICSGISNGTGLLQCCKKHCRNVISDRNNCGRKCGFGQLCCGGKCTDISYNADHCGKCDKKCSNGVKCEYGVCGYA